MTNTYKVMLCKLYSHAIKYLGYLFVKHKYSYQRRKCKNTNIFMYMSSVRSHVTYCNQHYNNQMTFLYIRVYSYFYVCVCFIHHFFSLLIREWWSCDIACDLYCIKHLSFKHFFRSNVSIWPSQISSFSEQCIGPNILILV